MKNHINFCLFSMILQNSQVIIYQWIETFFCSLANFDRFQKFKILVVCLDLTMKTTLIFACFLWFWKTRKLPFIDESKLSFCSVANVGLTNLSRTFFVTSRGSTLHQIMSPPSSLKCNPVYWTRISQFLHFSILYVVRALHF